MIDPSAATAILTTFIIIFAIVLPVMDVKCPQYVSFRWLCIVVVLALLIGVVIDFSELDSESRHIIILGGLIIVGGYIALRTVEKLSIGRKIRMKGNVLGKVEGEIDIDGGEKDENIH